LNDTIGRKAAVSGQAVSRIRNIEADMRSGPVSWPLLQGQAAGLKKTCPKTMRTDEKQAIIIADL
jgi:hypothetical protein